jgi:hypothetical protein
MWRHRVRNYVFRPDRSDRWYRNKVDPPMPSQEEQEGREEAEAGPAAGVTARDDGGRVAG